MIKRILKTIAICMLASMAPWAHAQAGGYVYTDISADGASYAYARGINEAGQIAGAVQLGYTGVYATVWNNGTPTLSSLSATYANAINNAGQTAGTLYVPYNDSRAVVWNGSTATILGRPDHDSHAAAINDAGLVAGWSGDNYSCCQKATVWNTAQGTQTTLSPVESEAHAINNAGQVAGWSSVNGLQHATVWNGTTTIDLGIPGTRSFAFGINDIGQVVGSVQAGPFPRNQATLWDGTNTTLLGSLGGDSFARDINNLGQIVGASRTQAQNALHATLWIGATAIDLNDFLDPQLVSEGWVLTDAKAINDAGWIVGMAERIANGDVITHGFLMAPVPVPEPSSYALFITGLCFVCLRAHRRRTA